MILRIFFPFNDEVDRASREIEVHYKKRLLAPVLKVFLLALNLLSKPAFVNGAARWPFLPFFVILRHA